MMSKYKVLWIFPYDIFPSNDLQGLANGLGTSWNILRI